MAADELRRRILDPRDLTTHAAPDLVDAPAIAGQPGEAGFDQYHLERGEFLEHALGDEAQELLLERGRVGGVLLDEIGWPAGVGRREPVARAGMEADRQVVALRRLVDRPEVAAA